MTHRAALERFYRAIFFANFFRIEIQVLDCFRRHRFVEFIFFHDSSQSRDGECGVHFEEVWRRSRAAAAKGIGRGGQQ